MTAGDSTGQARPRLGWPTMIAFSMGTMSRSMKSRALAVFLLLYYNQVIGLSPALVSSIIFVSVVFDALVDPFVGQVSDNFRSRLGRRHPFMYAAALPAPLLFFALWNPPAGQSDAMVAAYLLVVLLALKLFDTFYELPSSALLPELVQDYDKRIIWITARSAFSHLATVGTVILAYNYFLKEQPDGSGGVLAREGYFNFALFGGLLMFVVMVVATIATHRQIPWLAEARAKTPSLGMMLKEAGATINNQSFLAFLAYGMTLAVAQGVKQAMDVYWNLYVFGLQQSQMALIPTLGLFGTVAGIVSAPWIIKRLGKKSALIWSLGLAFVFMVLPLALWLAGLTPPKGSDPLVALLTADQIVQQALWVMITICGAGLLADVVEDAEVKTGRRSEGVLFAAEGLLGKGVGGFGALSAGLLLTFAQFPEGAERNNVPEETLRTLALGFLPTIAVMFTLAIVAICFYRITRAKHEENLSILQERSDAGAAGVADQTRA